jgi:hypothetical protein
MVITELSLRKIVQRELKKFLFEEDIAMAHSGGGNINVELPQDQEETTVTMSAEEIAQIATDISQDSQINPDSQSNEADIDSFLANRKIN